MCQSICQTPDTFCCCIAYCAHIDNAETDRLSSLRLPSVQPPMIFCHPQAKFFHRKVICRTSPNASSDSMQYAHDCTDSESVYMMKETTSAAAVRVMDESNLHNSSFEAVPQSGESGCHFRTPSKTFYVSSIFIGLSFCNQNMKSADVTPSILDFIYRVNIYEGKRASMGINVTVSLMSRFILLHQPFCRFPHFLPHLNTAHCSLSLLRKFHISLEKRHPLRHAPHPNKVIFFCSFVA